MATEEELKKRIGVLQDIREIEELHRKYVYCLCSRQWDELLDCFADDAVTDIGSNGLRLGKKEIEEMVYGKFDKLERTPGHMAAQPVITVDGDMATGYWILYLFSKNLPGEWVQGRHECLYRKINGKWRFGYVKYVRPWPPEPSDH